MLKKTLLVLVAALVLWYLGHILLESVWTLARVPETSPLHRLGSLTLIPVCLAAAWLVLGRPRSAA